MMMRLKYFHDGLNIEVILALGRQFSSPKCDQFTLTSPELN